MRMRRKRWQNEFTNMKTNAAFRKDVRKIQAAISTFLLDWVTAVVIATSCLMMAKVLLMEQPTTISILH